MESTTRNTIVEVSDSDLSPTIIALASARANGGRVLGPDNISTAFVQALVTRLRSMCPDGYDLGDIEMDVRVTGTLLGSSVGGSAKVKFVPQRK